MITITLDNNTTIELPEESSGKDLVEKLNLKYRVRVETSHPKTHLVQSGYVVIEKEKPKREMLKIIGIQLKTDREIVKH